MDMQVINNSLRKNFNISNVPGFTSETIGLALVNRNTELKLENRLVEIEIELKEIAAILVRRNESAYGVYAILLANLEKAVLIIRDLFDSLMDVDHIEASLILEKIKVKILRLDEKIDTLATFVYAWDQESA